jgi:hypothetical protein
MTPPEVVDPDITMSRFVPIELNTFSTPAFAPSPMATIEITEATPMTTPSVVKKERVLFLRSARTATGNV